MQKIFSVLLLLVILTFVTAISLSQDKGEVGIIQMKKVTNKLNKNMTRDEIEKLIGKPTFETNLGPVYWFEGGERLILRYNVDQLASAFNKGNINLLATEYSARDDTTLILPIFINDKELILLSPLTVIYILLLKTLKKH